MVTQTVHCQVCGKTVTKEFKIYRHDRVVCSEECRKLKDKQLYHEWYLKNRPKDFTRTCPTCGKMFTRTNNGQIYCSAKCRGTKKKKADKPSTITEINLKAKELGMSYGKYQAQKYIEEMRAKNER